MASGSGGGGSEFSVVVVGSNFATDAGAALLGPNDREVWHDCLPDLAEADACFSDLEELQGVRVQGTDRASRTIVRVVSKNFPGCNKQSNWTHTASDVSFEMAFRQSEDDAQEGHHANVADIIPSLQLETRWRPFRLRHYAGFWVPQVPLKIGIPIVHSRLEPRPTDVFIASYPKSGTTWLKALAFATLKRFTHPPCDDDHPLRHCGPHDCVNYLEIGMNTGNEFEALPSPRVLSTHLPYSLLPSSITGESSGCRIVYICREPKDVLVSFWLFTRKMTPASGVDTQSFTIQEAFELLCQGRCPYGPLWQHVLQYWEESVRRPDSKVLFLRYEEMLLEPESQVKKLARFMGCEFSEEEEESGVISAIVELCSLGKLRDMEVNRNGKNRIGIKNESFFRKGVAGDWSNHMTPEMAQRLDKVVEDALQGTGFTFASTA